MNKPLRSILLLSALFGALLALVLVTVPNAHAQSASDTLTISATAPAADNTAAEVATGVVHVLAKVLPPKLAGWLVALGSIAGTIGLFTKPIMSAIEAGVRASPSTSDDELLDKVEHSQAFKVFAWLLDFFTRIKIGPQFTAKPQPVPAPARAPEPQPAAQG
jgi:hypothetical protein